MKNQRLVFPVEGKVRVTDVNWTYCVHFAVHTKIQSLRCTPETNVMWYVNYISIKQWI